MLRDLARFLAVSLLIAGAAGWLYGAAVIGVLPVYGLIIVAGVISMVGYVRWDLRHFG
jgi:hypothetical protein